MALSYKDFKVGDKVEYKHFTGGKGIVEKSTPQGGVTIRFLGNPFTDVLRIPARYLKFTSENTLVKILE